MLSQKISETAAKSKDDCLMGTRVVQVVGVGVSGGIGVISTDCRNSPGVGGAARWSGGRRKLTS